MYCENQLLVNILIIYVIYFNQKHNSLWRDTIDYFTWILCYYILGNFVSRTFMQIEGLT